MSYSDISIDGVTAQAFTLPTDGPEADGTMAWSATTIIVVHVMAGDRVGLVYTYSDASVARLIEVHRIGLVTVLCRLGSD